MAGDLTRDGKPETIVGYVGAPGIVYFNDGTGKNYPRSASATALEPSTAWDLDGDGWPGVVVARSNAILLNRK
jgi:hypothetical protein